MKPKQQIQELLKEHNPQLSVTGLVKVSASGAEAAPDSDVESPETYVGYDRADSFLSPGGLKQDVPHAYTAPKHLELNQWGFAGTWTDRAQAASLDSARGKNRLPVPCAGCASGAGAGGEWKAGSLPGED